MSSTDSLHKWLESLSAALRSLPARDREDIRREVEEHLNDRIAAGVPVEQVIAGFGDPSEYAKAFAEEFALTRARESGQIFKMFRAIAGIARKSIVAALGLGVAFFWALWIAGGAICLVLKVAKPSSVGLWIDRPFDAAHRYVHTGAQSIPLRLGNDHIQFGYVNPTPTFHEVLGPWMFPVLFLFILFGYFALRFTLLGTLKRLIRRRA